MGQNPAVGAPNARLERRALANLQWLVVRDMVETETATFWQDSPEVQRGELRTERHRHRSVLLPGGRARRKGQAASRTRSGCCSGTRRPSIRPATHAARPGSSITSAGGSRRRAAARSAAAQRGLNALTWDYPTAGPHDEPDIDARAAGDQRATTRRRCAGRRASASSGSGRHRPRAAAGSTPACIRQPAAIARANATRRGRTATAGDSPGRPIDASSTTAPPRDPTARRGASARSWSGGTTRTQRMDRTRHAGLHAATSAPDYVPPTRRRAAMRRFAAMRRSSCIPTASAGSGCRAASRTVRCRRTTSRSSRRSATVCIAQQVESGRGSEGAARQPVRAVAGRSALSRTCSRPTG